MRISYHNGRADKNGRVYSSKHNDRNFNINNAPHIDKNPQLQNVTWNYYHSNETFEQVEQRFYEEHFLQALDNQNQRYIANRQQGRVKTMNDYLKGKQTCPEEVIIQIGSSKNGNASPELLQKIFEEQLQWETERFKNVVTLDWALHTDEATPHIHQRKVWIAKDKDGNQIVSQTKALKAMGIERPDTSKGNSKYNNEKQTYTEMCRQHFQELCLQHGLEIETEPIAQSQKSLSITEYKAKQAKQELDNISHELGSKKIDFLDFQRDYSNVQRQLKGYQKELEQTIHDIDFIKELRSLEWSVRGAAIVPDEELIQAPKVRYNDKPGYFISEPQMQRCLDLDKLSKKFDILFAKLNSLVTTLSRSLSFLFAREHGIDTYNEEFDSKIESIIKPQIIQIANSPEVNKHEPQLKRIIDDGLDLE